LREKERERKVNRDLKNSLPFSNLRNTRDYSKKNPGFGGAFEIPKKHILRN